MTKINKEGWEIKRLNEVCSKGSSNIVISKLDNNEGNYPLFGASGLVKNIDFFQQDKPYIGIVKDGAGVGRVGIYPAHSSLVGTMQYIFPNDNCLLEYVKYFLIKLNLAKHVSGATIPHIYFKDYGQEKIPVPSKDIQQRIVEELDEINAIISAKKQQLSKLDELAQSIFYNMFGDPVANEKGWEVKELKSNVEEMFLGPFGSALKVDSYVPESESYAMVYEQKHAIQATLHLDNHFISEEKFNSLARFEVKGGDFIMSCRGTIGKIYQLPSNAPRGIIHPSLMKIRILPEAYAATFFVFMLKKVIELQQTKGNCVQMAITAKELGVKKVILPPLPLQEAFAARVAAIEEQKSSIAASIEKMQTLLDARMQEYFG